jgi:hypothetical protein
MKIIWNVHCSQHQHTHNSNTHYPSKHKRVNNTCVTKVQHEENVLKKGPCSIKNKTFRWRPSLAHKQCDQTLQWRAPHAHTNDLVLEVSIKGDVFQHTRGTSKTTSKLLESSTKVNCHCWRRFVREGIWASTLKVPWKLATILGGALWEKASKPMNGKWRKKSQSQAWGQEKGEEKEKGQ